MISFPNVNELHGFDSRRKTLIAMLAINMSILQETVLTSDGKKHPRVTYLRDLRGTYFNPVLGARINDGVIEVEINAVNPEWRAIGYHEMIEDSFGVVVYCPCSVFYDLDLDIVDLDELTANIGLMLQPS